MNYTLLVISPLNIRYSSHFSENKIDFFHTFNSISFQNAIRDTSPRVTGRELDFDTNIINLNIWECLSMGVKVYLNTITNYVLNHPSHPVLKRLSICKSFRLSLIGKHRYYLIK